MPAGFKPKSSRSRAARRAWRTEPDRKSQRSPETRGSSTPNSTSSRSSARARPEAASTSSRATSASSARGWSGSLIAASSTEMGPRIEAREPTELVVELLLAVREGRRRHDLEHAIEIAMPAPLRRQALAGEAQLLSRARARAYRHFHAAAEGRHLDVGAQHRLPRRDRQLEIEIMPGRLVERVGTQHDVQIEIARRPPVHARPALARDAQPLAVGDALRHPDADGLRHAVDRAVGSHLRRGKVEAHLGAVVDLLEREVGSDLIVLPRHREAAAPGAPAAPGAAAEPLEELREIDEVVEVPFLEPELALPPRGRAELLARPVTTELVVRCPLLEVGERLVGLVDLLESLLGVLLLGDVRVVLARELPVRLLDVVLGGVAGEAENLVVILVFHRVRPANSP